MRKIIKGWNWMRFLRLLMGIFILVEGIQNQQIFFIIMGMFFSALPLLNIGCCSSGACSTKAHDPSDNETVTFTEIK